MAGRCSRRYRRADAAGGGSASAGSRPARCMTTVARGWVGRPSVATSHLPVRGLHDVRPRGDELVAGDLEVRPERLGVLLAGDEVGLVDAQDLHELDPRHLVDDAEELALV